MWKNEKERADKMEWEKIPSLRIIDKPQRRGGPNFTSLEWWLEIRNEGAGTANDCRACLEDITTVIPSKKLADFTDIY